MHETKPVGMKRLAFKAAKNIFRMLPKFLRKLEARTIITIAHDRVVDMLHMDTNLMCAARFKLRFY